MILKRDVDLAIQHLKQVLREIEQGVEHEVELVATKVFHRLNGTERKAAAEAQAAAAAKQGEERAAAEAQAAADAKHAEETADAEAAAKAEAEAADAKRLHAEAETSPLRPQPAE